AQAVQAYDTSAADTAKPSVAITDDTANAIATGPVTYTFTFSEAVSGFDASKVTVSGGTKGVFTALSASTYTLVVTPAANSTGNLTVDVSAGAGQDAAGNLSLAAAQAVQAYDTSAADTAKPSVAITDDTANAIATGPVTYTFTFSE
ncbi:Ig-like domain-containing protein, partial [Neisseria gonorrhoeae]|uniref:Ig-like domain-containing protein n=2 Tax=Neisseria gonorrhoeae TaxID=485 RepID=UPI00311D992E